MGKSKGFVFIGLALGGITGFLLRPSVPLVGQLPLETVLTRGSELKGFNAMLIPYAETSFNYVLAGAIIGAGFFWFFSKR
ncbi:hypothetical protein [uncultured Methanomethylovorans sp.]|uniref:hypothetical protein n=1 Tax=uncultured Methanomethylovorans sp. TaxID=183759 RepID=UPI002AA6F2A7|nr:hypothetical protein [uncultured Methanomethylovorans sp.]